MKDRDGDKERDQDTEERKEQRANNLLEEHVVDYWLGCGEDVIGVNAGEVRPIR
eukprot:m.139703 g.139703  ORF g.139703 m.139703 type:complete len:54 (-) comp15954_c0_seq7:279-440(-)